MRARLATSADAASIAGIYNQAIEERTATFETDLRTEDEIVAWFDGSHPVVVVVNDAALVVAFARTSEYRPRDCYRGVFEFAVYTDHPYRRRGAGALAMRELITQARAAGAWKLLSRVFVENDGSRALLASLGFREVGTYYRHARLDGRWRDVVIVEKFLAPIAVDAAVGFLAGTRRHEVLRLLRSTSIEERLQALEGARLLIEPHRPPDKDVLDAVADAFFMAKVHHPSARGRFIELFRAYAALSLDAAQDLYTALFAPLDRWSIARELDAFYEALFVVKQVAFVSDGRHAPDLAPHVPRLIAWLQQAIELPQRLRTRISPGNVTSLLMTLATAGCESEQQKRHVLELAVEAKARHRVDPPVALRSSAPPPPPIEAAEIPSLAPPPISAELRELAASEEPLSEEPVSEEVAPKKKTRRGGPSSSGALPQPPRSESVLSLEGVTKNGVSTNDAPITERSAAARTAAEPAPPAEPRKKRGRKRSRPK